MKNQDLFNKTIDILVKAYQNDTLMHNNCYACAVGNLVAYNLNYEFIPDETGEVPIKWKGYSRMAAWTNVFCTYSNEGQNVFPSNYLGNAKHEIDSTGYHFMELAKIELAFEMAEQVHSEDEWMFNGLMAVVDALMEIHEATETECKEAKELFIKA